MLNISKTFSPRNIAVFTLVLYCIRYIPLETRGSISPIKTAFSLLAPLFLLIYSPKISKALLWGVLYFLAVLFSALFNIESFRSSTILYLASFIGVFIMYYNFVYLEKVFTLDFFILLLKRLILAYTITLLIQQCFIIVGIKYFPLINLCQILNRGIGANALSGEPSSSARILTVLFLSLLRMYEVKWDKENVNIKAIYTDAKWVLLGFLWSMLTMGSGTAFVGLAILSLYFIKRQYVFTIVPVLTILYFVIPYIEFEPLQRAKVTIEATLTMDVNNVIEADGSAADRVAPIMNSITELDITDSDVWFGRGIDASFDKDRKGRTLYDDYGFLAYILSLVFVFSCCIKFGGLETIMFFIGIGGGTGNIAYGWGILLIFTTAKYFMDNYKRYGKD